MMKTLPAIIIILVSVMVPVTAQHASPRQLSSEPVARFEPLHIYIDSGDKTLAAFQFELKTVAGEVKIVGVEGGEHRAFAEPAYYDPAALANDRIIIADFNTGEDLPTGCSRIATVHLQIIGELKPEYELELSVAASPHGERIPAEIAFEKGEIK